jgi:dihydrofolate reductase
MVDKARVVIVAALGKNRVIGDGNGLLWHISDDLKRFKEKTGNHPVIMGRKTFESILAVLGKPLPGRANIVITRNPDYAHEGAIIVSSLEDAFKVAGTLDTEEVHIGGGAEIYALALPYVDALYLTHIDDSPEGDAYFPAYEDDFEAVEIHPAREHDGLPYQWIDYERRRS